MKIAIGAFAHNGISTCLGPDIGAALRAALAHFTDSLDSDSPPLEPPAWLVGGGGAEATCAVELSVDERTLGRLRREAARQGTTIDRLATHSALVYLAELDRQASSREVAAL